MTDRTQPLKTNSSPNAHNLKREVKMGCIDNMTGAYIAA